MKAAKLLFYLLVLPIFIHAQEVDDMLVYEQKEISKYLGSTTYFVLDQFEESPYSLALKAAIEKYWNVTKFEIIDQGTFREYNKDKTKSFATRNYIAGDKDYISLNLFMGGQRGMETRGKILASVKLKHYSEPDEAMLYKIPTYVQNLQWQVQMKKNNEFSTAMDFENFIRKQAYIKNSRTLYILKDHLTHKIDDMDRVKKAYKHDVALVDAEQINQAITKEDTSVIYLSIVAPIKNWGGRNAYYRIYTAKGGETLISYTRAVSSSAPLGVTGYDLKVFNK
ncbi:MAG: hypothetical protein RIC15_03945 [Vicingaceae bacterium]